jgi:hypothetical protein
MVRASSRTPGGRGAASPDWSLDARGRRTGNRSAPQAPAPAELTPAYARRSGQKLALAPLARIILGLSLCFCTLNRLPDAQLIYGPEGLLGPELATRLDTEDLYGEAANFAAWTEGLRAFVPAPSAAAVWLLHGVLILSSLCFALGLFTRSSGVLALAVHHFLVTSLAPYSYWGWSLHIQPLMAYLLCAPTGRYWSLDSMRARRRTGDEAVPLGAWVATAWPLRLIQIHTCTMYAVTGWARIDDSGWLAGEAVFDAVTVALHAKFALSWQPLKPLLVLGTYAAFVLEGLAPIVLWMGRLGTLWAYLLIAMHATLELTTNLGWWSHIMIASLLCFVPPRHLQALLTRAPLIGLAPVRAAPATRIRKATPRTAGS